MVIYELGTPFTSSIRRKELIADKLLIWFALEFVNGDINCTTSAVKHHYDGALDHLGGQAFLSIVTALDGCTFWLQTK